MDKTVEKEEHNASRLITQQILELAEWRGQLLERLRRMILATAPGITEEWKWGTAVWSEKGMICSAAAFRDHVKLNFFKGAWLQDPQSLFNSGLDAKATRAIDFHEDEHIDEPALKELIQTALAYNLSAAKRG